ncbi:MAG TPA: ASKHA domain-containing protein, partial [Anaerolineales bacterium]|nr:ASKHA domain-containing protein [Anaerolineales bacterium]
RTLGVELESICGGRQTCGKCQVIVESGAYPKHGITSRESHLSSVGPVEAEYCRAHDIRGRRLACAAEIVGDVLILVPEESQARKQIIAKAATERAIDVDPAVRSVYVEVRSAELGSGGGGDWERLQEALREQWQLTDLRIDTPALQQLQPALAVGRHAVTVSVWNAREVLRIQPGYAEGICGLAIDVGTTTVVAHVCDLRTGEVLATEASMNPQVRYGEDLMSRVSYAMTQPQGVERMHRAIIRTLNDLAEKAVSTAGRALDDILDAVVVGNPIMHHLVLGLDPSSLGAAPFAPALTAAADTKARDLGLKFNPSAYVHTLPCIAGHVGADHLAVLLAEAPHALDEISLVVDVGTNAEISIGGRAGLACASSPTGPAFEGAQITHGQRAAPGAIERVRVDSVTLEPRYQVIGHEGWIDAVEPRPLPMSARATGICGSGIIEAVAEMFLAGVIDSNGRFADDAADRSSRVRREGRSAAYVLVDAADSATGNPIVVSQTDVRAIQLAKAALYTGAKLLLRHQGLPNVDRIVLAGAFGSYISPRHAMILGLIPDAPLDRVAAVGNAAGDGARLALLNLGQRAEAGRLAGWVQHVQIATDPSFQDEFVAAMSLPHAADAFPHLADDLPAITQPAERPSQRRRAVGAGLSRKE